MKALIILIIVLVVIINGYTFIKQKRRAGKAINALYFFKRRYSKNNEAPKIKTSKKTDNYNNYITKYNSTLDYIDKNEFLNSVADTSQHKSVLQGERKQNGLHNNFM